MPTPLTVAEAHELIRLCEAGRLFAVDAWIRAGRSLTVPSEVRRTPLEVAISTGFHSLVELLLRHAESQEAKDEALRDALLGNRRPFIELAITYGADVRAVPFIDVLMTGDRGVVSLFLERGADPITGDPFAHAFHELRAKTTLGSYLDCRRNRPDLTEALQRQADIALRQFCSDGNLKWVSLMIWVGADPRSRGPMLEDVDGSEAYTTAMHEACASGHVEIVKRLRPTSADDLAGMLDRAAFGADHDVLAYLLDLGANPNDRPDGGSNALESAIRYLGWEDFDRIRYAHGANYQTPGYKLPKGREAIKVLLQRGAQWKPDPATLNHTRRILYKVEPAVAVELIAQLQKTEGGADGVRELLRVPRMRQHIAECAPRLARLGVDVGRQRRVNGPETRSLSPRLLARYDRERLYEEVWSEPAQKVARQHGISDVMLSKICRQLEVPKPPRGYWAKKAAHHAVPRRPKLQPFGARARHRRTRGGNA